MILQFIYVECFYSKMAFCTDVELIYRVVGASFPIFY